MHFHPLDPWQLTFDRRECVEPVTHNQRRHWQLEAVHVDHASEITARDGVLNFGAAAWNCEGLCIAKANKLCVLYSSSGRERGCVIYTFK